MSMRSFTHTNWGIYASGKPLRRTREAFLASPTGMSFGYAGSGCYATAHSMLAHLFGLKVADRYAMQFKFDVVANLKPDFELPYSEVRAWLKHQESDK